MLAIGLMSGTSGDGVDAGLVEISNDSGIDMKLLEFNTFTYSQKLKNYIENILPPYAGSINELVYIHYHLGQKFGQAALSLIEKSGVDRREIGLIASHGHTVRNLPPKDSFFPSRCRFQIGEIAVIAEMTGITTVGDFRPAEVAAGGEGAPLIPYFDYHLLQSAHKNRVILNIGGIANISYIPAGGSIDDLKAFDVGPGNMIIDEVVNRITDGEKDYDENGELAAEGEIDERLLAELMQHSFVIDRPPKSAGHEDFGSDYVDKVMAMAERFNVINEDLIATVTAFTGEAIAFNCERYLGPVDEVIVSGGGAYNTTLIRRLKERLAECKISTTEDYGIPIEAKEAMGFALLGYQTLNRVPNNVPAATGARHPAVMGKIAWGRN